MSGSSVDLPCSSNARSEFVFDVSESKKFDQAELNDLARDFGLSKKSSEIFASREKNLLSLKTKISYFRTRDAEFQQYFTQSNHSVYSHDILSLLKNVGNDNYDPTEWRLFIDSCKIASNMFYSTMETCSALFRRVKIAKK